MAAKVAQQSRKDDYETSDTESVVTQMALEDSDSDFDAPTPSTNRKRLASSASSFHQNGAKRPMLVERQPTRRPDPNVSNRNALMARENRKRKKEQMENLEQQNENLQRDLKRLQKMVQRQEVIITGLRNERNYLKGVLENQSEIAKLLKKLQNEKEEELEQQQQLQQPRAKQENGASPNSVYSDSGMSFGGEGSPFHGGDDDDEEETQNLFDHGTLLEDACLEAALNADFPLLSTDLMFSAGGGDVPADELLNFDFPDALIDEEEEEADNLNGNNQTQVIRSEHNYVHPDVCVPKDAGRGPANKVTLPATSTHRSSESESQRPGICFHIRGGGKVSLEFCSKCHESATRDWHFKRL